MRTSLIALAAALAVTAPVHAETADQSTGWTPSEIVVTERKDDGYKVTDAASLRRLVQILKTPQSVQVFFRYFSNDSLTRERPMLFRWFSKDAIYD